MVGEDRGTGIGSPGPGVAILDDCTDQGGAGRRNPDSPMQSSRFVTAFSEITTGNRCRPPSHVSRQRAENAFPFIPEGVFLYRASLWHGLWLFYHGSGSYPSLYGKCTATGHFREGGLLLAVATADRRQGSDEGVKVLLFEHGASAELDRVKQAVRNMPINGWTANLEHPSHFGYGEYLLHELIITYLLALSNKKLDRAEKGAKLTIQYVTLYITKRRVYQWQRRRKVKMRGVG